jgi:hypothetical protein
METPNLAARILKMTAAIKVERTGSERFPSVVGYTLTPQTVEAE